MPFTFIHNFFFSSSLSAQNFSTFIFPVSPWNICATHSLLYGNGKWEKKKSSWATNILLNNYVHQITNSGRRKKKPSANSCRTYRHLNRLTLPMTKSNPIIQSLIRLSEARPQWMRACPYSSCTQSTHVIATCLFCRLRLKSIRFNRSFDVSVQRWGFILSLLHLILSLICIYLCYSGKCTDMKNVRAVENETTTTTSTIKKIDPQNETWKERQTDRDRQIVVKKEEKKSNEHAVIKVVEKRWYPAHLKSFVVLYRMVLLFSF